MRQRLLSKFYLLILFALFGCAIADIKPSLVTETNLNPEQAVILLHAQSQAEPLVVITPFVQHWKCTDTNGAPPPADNWTNYYSFIGAVATTNNLLPMDQWQPIPVTMETRNGYLGFVTTTTEPILFLQAVFQTIPDTTIYAPQ